MCNNMTKVLILMFHQTFKGHKEELWRSQRDLPLSDVSDMKVVPVSPPVLIFVENFFFKSDFTMISEL